MSFYYFLCYTEEPAQTEAPFLDVSSLYTFLAIIHRRKTGIIVSAAGQQGECDNKPVFTTPPHSPESSQKHFVIQK